MKKYRSLELAIAFFMCTIAFYFGGIYLNFNFQNHFFEQICKVSTDENSSNSDLIYADLTTEEAKQIDVLFFCYKEDKSNPNKNPTLGTGNISLPNINASLNKFNEYINIASNNNASVNFNIVSTSSITTTPDKGNPLILEIDKPTSINKASVFSAVMQGLQTFTRSGSIEDAKYLNISLTGKLSNDGNDIMLVYLDYKSYLGMALGEAEARYSENTSGVFSLEYSTNSTTNYLYYTKQNYQEALSDESITGTATNINNYFLIHSDALTSFLITENDAPNFYNKAITKYTKMMLNLYGLPNLSYYEGSTENTTYAGNHSILSNGTYYAPFNKMNPYYAYLLGQAINPSHGWLSEVCSVTKLVKECEIAFDLDGNNIYYIQPSGYEEQAILIYYVPSLEYREWTYNDGEGMPPHNGYVVVARIQTAKNEDGSYVSANANYAPFYVFEPSSINGELLNRGSTLENARLANVGDSIGFLETSQEVASSSPHTGYISLKKNDLFINTSLKISVIEKTDSGTKIKIECNNGDILLPENVAIQQPLIDVENLSTDVAIYLYNKFVEIKGASILADADYQTMHGIHFPPSVMSVEDLKYSNELETAEETWNDFYNNSGYAWRTALFDSITTYDFSRLTTLDLYGQRDVTSLKFLQEINFQSVQKLCLSGIDLSSGDGKTKSESELSLEYISVLENLQVLELNSCNIQDISFLRSLGSVDNPSKLKQLSLMDNKISNITPINGEFLVNLSYVNLHLNNISNESLNQKYRSSTTNFYNSTAVDVGIQRFSSDLFTTIKSEFIFKNWTMSSFSNILTTSPLKFSRTFDAENGDAQYVYAHDPNGTSTEGDFAPGGIKLFSLEHGQYALAETEYHSLISPNFNIDAITRTIPSRLLNCYFMEFKYAEEEVCQTPSTEEYFTALGSYNELNPLINFTESHFSQYELVIKTYSVTNELISEISSIDLNVPGDYLINYSFKFNDNLKTNLFKLPASFTLIDIVVSKTLKVLEYKKINFESSDSPINGTIIDPILYKSLLYLAGKVDNIDELAFLDDNRLGVENTYTIYNQDFYFYKVNNKHTPSILELRLNPPANLEIEKGVLTVLDISSIAQKIIKKKLKINDNTELPEDIINSISGIEYINLKSIEEINLNALGITSIKEISNSAILPKIKILNAGGNKIDRIDNINQLQTLEYLDLSFNSISDPTPLKELTDPTVLQSRGFSKQTIKKINISFNNITIMGNGRMNSNGISEYSLGNSKNKFLLDSMVPSSGSFVAQNEIYIVLVQMLSNFEHYGNSSKWEYYYTPALAVGNGELYVVKYGKGNAQPSQSTSNFKNNTKHTDYSTDAGNYTISSTLSTDLANRNNIPFQPFTKTLYYTVTKASVTSLEKNYGALFPSNLLLHNSSTSVNGNLITYTMLTTEYEQFLKNLQEGMTEEEKANFSFGARKKDVSLLTSSKYWAYNPITGAGINFFDDTYKGEPLKIEVETDDNSNNSNIENLYVKLTYTISFYKTDTRTNNDSFAELANPVHIDRIVIFVRINLVYNPAISFADENLKNILLLKLSKDDGNREIFAYDFYNVEELDLSNAKITTFNIAEGANSQTVVGFEKMIFNNLTKINLSNNLIKNSANGGSNDPLYRLFANTTIFPTNVNLEHKIEYLDLSYNQLSSLVPLSEKLFKRPITVNLFGNSIDFIENSNNREIISNPDFYNGGLTPCNVFIGIQGLGSGNLQKLISFKKNITCSEDTFAKFVVFTGNFYVGVNDISYDFSGAEIEYRDLNSQIVLSKSDSLFTIYYYKNTYYMNNQNYRVSYEFSYNNMIDIKLNATIVHQKLYFDIITNENGEEIEANTVYKEFHNDYDINAFNEYNKSILEEDIFVYENANPLDFKITYKLYDAYSNDLQGVLYSNKLTFDTPYTQLYEIAHLDSDMFYRFPKLIHIVDSIAPIISTNSPDSKTKYVVLKGSTYAPYYANRIDKDLIFIDDYDQYYFKETLNPLIRVTIIKDGEILSEVEANWKDTQSGLSINCNNPGIYEIRYVAIDSNGNESEPFIRNVEVYYQPYSYIKLKDFSAMFSAGKTIMTASVYKTEEDANRNNQPTFYWYVDGKFVGTSFVNPEISNSSSLNTSIEVFVEGAGTHNIQVFIDITKESYEENVALGIAGSLASSTKSTSIFILMDNKVMNSTLIGAGIIVVLIIILIIVIIVVRRKKEARRNEYSYTIIKHDK